MTAEADTALARAWELRIEDWTDAVADEYEQLLATLLSAGYAATDGENWTWWFTTEGVARAEALERDAVSRA